MKVTIVTVSFNAKNTIGHTLRSVQTQTHPDIEHIVIDGGSTDGTQDVVVEHGAHLARFVSERDDGLYDAMNKGWKIATGDLIGYLHADDYFSDDTCVSRIAALAETSNADIILGDVDIVAPDNLSRTIRVYSARDFSPVWIEQGDMPPYPGLYVRRSVFERHGGYDLQFRISADFDFVARMLYVHKLSYAILPYTLVKMRWGGLSTRWPWGPLKMLRDVYRACRKNGVPATPVSIAQKYLRKIRQFGNVHQRA
jgi:glycosyltransferase involved in cell wall biosynthesis